MQNPVAVALAAGALASCAIAASPAGPDLLNRGLVYPESAETPRHLTDAERRFIQLNPIVNLRGTTAPPAGDIRCAAEYEPMDGIVVGYEGSTSWLNILAQLGAQVTTTGNAKFYVITDSGSEPADATNRLNSFGANLSNVVFMSRTLDSIWMRDYGPRYIYQGDCRAVVDHTYNRPRPNDNLFPVFFAAQKGHAHYEHQLVHGGGNYHLDAVGFSYATRLINNENPGLTESQIHNIWQQYQNVDTTFTTPFPTNVDATQHIDMWMQVASDNLVFISDWPNNPGSAQDVICDSTATMLTNAGYTVVRLPAYSTSGTHYTFSNMVMCNNVVIVPQYSVNPAFSQNAAVLATIQNALPGKTVVGVSGQAIVTAAGVFHCIVMHVPAHLGGANPTAYLTNESQFRGGGSVEPGESVALNWVSDDDVLVSSVDVRLSTDGGATFPTVIASAQPRLGSTNWIVPGDAEYTDEAVIRIIARDAQNNTGTFDSEPFIINGSPACLGDLDDSDDIGFGDLNILLGNYGGSGAGDLDGDGDVDFSDLNTLLGLYGQSC